MVNGGAENYRIYYLREQERETLFREFRGNPRSL